MSSNKGTCVYILENNLTGKSYVGQTINYKKRIIYHKNSKNTYIGRAISKYGWENFKQLIYYIPRILLDYYEIEMIKKVNTISPNGYNLRSGGSHGLHTKESNEKNRLSHIGKIPWNKGLKMSEEFKNRYRGIKRSDETKKKISEFKKGTKCSNKTRERMSESRKRYWKKLKEQGYQFKHTEATKNKQREYSKNRIKSLEEREKLSKATTAYWQRKKKKGEIQCPHS